LALECLEAVDEAFDWTRAPGIGDSGFDCVDVASNSFGHPIQFGARGIDDLSFESGFVVASDESCKPARQAGGYFKFRRVLEQVMGKTLGSVVECARLPAQ